MQNNQVLDRRILELLEITDKETQRRLCAFAIEILGLQANETGNLAPCEIEEEMEQAGLQEFYEENERFLRRLRREGP